MMDKSEDAFGVLQTHLEANDFASWTEKEFELLMELMAHYYQGMHPSGSDEEGEEAEELEELGEDELRLTMPAEEVIAEVDRSLSKVRHAMKRKLPYGSMDEPTHVQWDAKPAASSAATGTTSSKSKAVEVSPPVYAIDSFLYTSDEVEELVEEGSVARQYCRACGCTNIAPTDFITHSFSQDQLVFLSSYLLPHLGSEVDRGAQRFSTKCVVDVGSRLGTVLWSCYFSAQQGILTATEQVVGVELNARYVELSQDFGRRFCSRPVELSRGDAKPANLSLRVVPSSCFEGEGLAALAAADVVILHNVFEYFCATEEEHARCWLQLSKAVSRPGQLLICSPSLESTLASFKKEATAALFQSSSTKGKKRAREAENVGGDEDPTALSASAKAWLDNYVEAIDVSYVSGAFVQSRSMEGGCGDDHAHDHEGHDHGEDGCCNEGGGCCGGENDEEEEESEMAEAVKNIFVYRVR